MTGTNETEEFTNGLIEGIYLENVNDLENGNDLENDNNTPIPTTTLILTEDYVLRSDDELPITSTCCDRRYNKHKLLIYPRSA